MEQYRKLSASASNSPTADNFEALLGEYPLLYGYWIKYALREFHTRGKEKAIQVFSRALDPCAHSSELWVAYIKFNIETNTPQDQILELFKQGARAIGMQFLSHNFWDIMIEYAKMHKVKYGLVPASPELEPVEEILFHILKTKTLHQFSRYYRELKQITKMEENFLIELYTRQQTRVSKVWRYERNLKRPFFHPQPLGDQERKIWVNYIDFITPSEKENLYNRALGIDPHNESLWMRYIRWSIASEDTNTEARLNRAEKYLPKSLVELRLYHALWLELHDPQRAKEYYESLAQTGRIYRQYAQFLERSGGDGVQLLQNIESEMSDTDAIEVLGEIIKYDAEAFAKSSRKSPEFFKGWMRYQPERADEIWERAPAGSIDEAYLRALRRTNIKKFVEMEFALNR